MEKAPLILGNVLVFASYLIAHAWAESTLVEGVCFVHSAEEPKGVSNLFYSIQGIEKLYYYKTQETFEDFLRQFVERPKLWPEEPEYHYGSILNMKKLYEQHGEFRSFCFKQKFVQESQEWLKKKIGPCLPVILHLKYDSSQTGESNANTSVWRAFIEEALRKFKDVRFILIGDDETDPRIEALPNVIVARKHGTTLIHDLVLIKLAFAFMGMSSGPCNVAIFGKVPYVIFKNPDHHPDQMDKELGKSDKFTFSKPYQRFLRVFETPEILMSEFSRIYENVDWKIQYEQRSVAVPS